MSLQQIVIDPAAIELPPTRTIYITVQFVGAPAPSQTRTA